MKNKSPSHPDGPPPSPGQRSATVTLSVFPETIPCKQAGGRLFHTKDITVYPLICFVPHGKTQKSESIIHEVSELMRTFSHNCFFFSYINEIKCYRKIEIFYDQQKNSMTFTANPVSSSPSPGVTTIINLLYPFNKLVYFHMHLYICLRTILCNFSIYIIAMCDIHSHYRQAFRFFQTFPPQMMMREVFCAYIFVHTREDTLRKIL